LGISEDGLKEVLLFFPVSSRESAEVWKEVLADLKERGLQEPLLFQKPTSRVASGTK